MSALGQVVLIHSRVGKSAADGKVENAIQGVPEQVRAIKLDLKVRTGLRLHLAHAFCPLLIRFAGQTLLLWIIDPSDGLTAMHRRRVTPRMSPKARIGE